MDRSEFLERLEDVAEEMETARTDHDWSDDLEHRLIRMIRDIEIFVSDAAQEYEDEE